jgi:protease I
MSRLSGLRVAILATDGFEESELTVPMKVLKDFGAQVDVVSIHANTIQGFRHFEKGAAVKVDRALHDAHPDDYDALVLPGGANNADALRAEPLAKDFVRAFESAGKPMAVICHAPWLLVSAELVRGRKLTSYHTIQDDIRNAGGIWEDRAVVEDRNWVTSRQPKDLPSFNAAMVRLFEKSAQLAHH